MKNKINAYNNIDLLIENEKNNLMSLIGKSIDCIYCAWDKTHDEFYSDIMIVIKIESIYLAISNIETDTITFTWSDTMFDIPIDEKTQKAYGICLYWKKNHIKINKKNKIINIEIAEFAINSSTILAKKNYQKNKQTYWILSGICFNLNDDYLSIYNSLDENEVSKKKIISNTLRYHSIISS